MNSVDLLVLVVLLLNALLGAIRGFVSQACRIAGLVLAFWLAGTYGQELGAWIGTRVDVGTEGRVVVAWVSIFVGVTLTSWTLIHLFRKGLAKARLTSADRSLGFLFGLLKGGLIVALIFQVLAFWSPQFIENQLLGSAEQNIPPSRAFALHRHWLRERIDRMVPAEVRRTSENEIEKRLFGGK